MGQLLSQENFNFTLENKYNPEELLKTILPDIEYATKGYVSGQISPYDGSIFSYKIRSPLYSISESLRIETTEDIQKKLGELSPLYKQYEIYLTAREIEDYKYRIMFLRFGVGGYPAITIVNEDLALEYTNGKANYVFEWNTMNEFQDFIIKILTSKKILTILQSIIDASIRGDYSL